MFDVAIIGAGPAGATLARLIGRERRVLLVDRRPLDAPADPAAAVPRKCCGGLLAPDAQKTLAEMGLGLPREVLVGPQLFVVRTIDLAARTERYYQRHYINLDREKFDRWLVSLVPPDVERCFGARLVSFQREGEGFSIAVSQDGRTRVERARLIIGADGANSAVSRLAFPGRPAPRKYLALQDWFDADEPLPYFSAIFDADITDFYCWTIPKEDALVVGGAFSPERGAAERLERLTARLADFGLHLGARRRRQAGILLRPLRANQICLGDGGVVLVGEAAGWISPSSAEGYSYAFRSAMALADALLQDFGDPTAAYRRNAARLRRNIIVKNLKLPFMYRPTLRRLVMASGLRSVTVRRNAGGCAHPPARQTDSTQSAAERVE